MRIITGLYRGRHFDIPRTFKARPTTDFAKENIFNVMNGYIDFQDATALDLFAGTGSISLELLSRGCATVVSVEKDRDHANFIHQCMAKIGTDKDILIRGDVFRFLKTCHQKFDFIFADPPYALPELPNIPSLIFEYDLLNEDGVFVFEHGKQNDFSENPHFLEHRSYGSVNFSIFR
jgi:16S rRNA (guanine966-N2)-methyltransferase